MNFIHLWIVFSANTYLGLITICTVTLLVLPNKPVQTSLTVATTLGARAGVIGWTWIVKNRLIFVIYSRTNILYNTYLWLLVKSAVIDQVGPILGYYEWYTEFYLMFSFNHSWRNKVFGTDEYLVLVSLHRVLYFSDICLSVHIAVHTPTHPGKYI